MNTASFVGNLTRDPDLRHSSNGKPRAVFTVAVNERWGDDDQEKTHFLNVTAFGTIGENAAASLSKGDRVLVMGRIDSYKKAVADQDSGEDFDVTMISFTASAVGPDLRFASAEVTRNPKGGNGNRAEGSADQADTSKSTKAAAQVDDDDEF